MWVPPGPLPGGVMQYEFESRWQAHSRGLMTEAQNRYRDEAAFHAAQQQQQQALSHAAAEADASSTALMLLLS